MNNENRRNRLRKTSGSVLVLAMIVIAFMVLPAAAFLYKYSLLLATRARYQKDTDAVALMVAERLSKIVVNDPHFGMIGLSNCPPIGKATLAGDQEPCPINGINTLLATVRLDTIIAHKLGNSSLCELANADYEQSQPAVKLLQSSLKGSINPQTKQNYFDMDGNKVAPYQEAQRMLERNLGTNGGGGKTEICNMRLSLGWIRQGGTTNTVVPAPCDQAQMRPEYMQNGRYKSCMDVPAYGYSFFFAPTAKAPALVEQSSYADPDGKRFCSVVKVEADIAYNDLTMCDNGVPAKRWLHVSACAMPSEYSQPGPTGALLVVFPCGTTDLVDLQDLLNLQGGETTQAYQAVNGDLPLDALAYTQPASLEPWGSQNITSDKVVAAGLYCWLRAAGIRPRIDSTINALSQQFQFALKGNNLLYEFDSHGGVVVSSLPAMPLPIGVVSDRQLFFETSCDRYMIGCYNNVYNLGTINGGKHAGQLLAGDPINWCDLQYFGRGVDYAASINCGPATGLTAVNNQEAVTDIPGAVIKNLVQFEINHQIVSAQPRKSYYSGGLAVELTISQL